MQPRCTWIVVVDGARARTYSVIGAAKKATEVEGGSFDNAALHTHARDTGTDRPGRTVDSAGLARHAEEPRTDTHRREKAQFAAFVAKRLEDRHEEFDALVLVAPPQVLGELRKHVGQQTAKRLVDEIDKDLTKVPPSELPARLASLVTRS